VRTVRVLNRRRCSVPGVCLLAIGLCAAGMAPALIAASAQTTSGQTQESFASAEDAVAALVKALQGDDTRALRAILGPGSDRLVASGDPVADANGRKRFLSDYAASHALMPQGDGRMVLVIGQDAWPLPIPLVQANGSWRFDAASGAQEIINRRIGRNELLTIRTLLAAVEAEQDYFDRMKRGSGTGVYARRFRSTPGNQDGLYWEVAPGEASSPLGPLIEQAESEGYPGAAAPHGRQTPYRGYLYRVLTSQGAEAPGGAKDYMRNGQMTEGFAFLAWPVQYGSSGVMTFMVDQDGVVFQKDLGPETAKIAAGMTRFDPDLSWARLEISD